jgi:hypothetical protein
MPYINRKDRPKIDKVVEQLPELNDGEFNYTVTSIAHRFIKAHKCRYMTLARVIGGLICVVLELYRRIAAPYEDEKIEQNGCVSDLDGDPDDYENRYICGCGHVFTEPREVVGSGDYYSTCPKCGSENYKRQ